MLFLKQTIKSSLSRQSSLGFTLVETLVAISILLTAVVAPMVLISGTISSIFANEDKIAALYFAEDAIDFVKYRISTNFNSSQPWLTGIIGFPACSYDEPCLVDSVNDVIQPCGGVCQVLKYNSAPYDADINPYAGAYGYGATWQDSKFRRTVILETVGNDPYPTPGNPQEIIITVQVGWEYKGVTREVEIVEHLFPWAS